MVASPTDDNRISAYGPSANNAGTHAQLDSADAPVYRQLAAICAPRVNLRSCRTKSHAVLAAPALSRATLSISEAAVPVSVMLVFAKWLRWIHVAEEYALVGCITGIAAPPAGGGTASGGRI